jgi:coenzyme Q-binding protein COQ10
MSVLRRTVERVLPHGPESLMAIVQDVARYPEFLKWVRAARVREGADGTVNADLLIGHRILTAPVSAQLWCSSPRQVKIRYRRGPVRSLSSQWEFHEIKTDQTSEITTKRCRVTVVVELDPGLLLAPVVNGMFDRAIDKLVDAFEQRAQEIYRDQAQGSC